MVHQRDLTDVSVDVLTCRLLVLFDRYLGLEVRRWQLKHIISELNRHAFIVELLLARLHDQIFSETAQLWMPR